MNHYLSNEDYTSVFSKVPRLCVDVVIRTDEGILLGLRSNHPYKDLWNTIGGMVYKGELLHDACIRIAKKETGLTVKINKFLGYTEYPNEEGGIHSVSVMFEALPVSGSLFSDSNTKELMYFKELPDNLIKEQKEFLNNLK